MNINYDVISLLTAVWKVTLRSSQLFCLSWPGRRGVVDAKLLAHMRDLKDRVCR